MSIERGEREALILARLAREGSLSVAGLARQLGVSETTIKSYRRKFPGCIPVAILTCGTHIRKSERMKRTFQKKNG